MKGKSSRLALVLSVAVLGWIGIDSNGSLVTTADAVIGRPATPVSYAGVARRSTVGVTAVGAVGVVGVGAVGVGAVGVGAVGVGAAPANLGGPVNRVGVR